MESKVLLVLVDGLRPDSIPLCPHPFLQAFLQSCTYTLHGLSVMPSITLPCHMSLFHSVLPSRHGIMDNTYHRPVHHIDGLFEVLKHQKKTCHFFYTWSELRDLCLPGSLAKSMLCNYYIYGVQADCEMCDYAIRSLENEKPDFIFYYTGNTDEVAHKYGWMSEEYLEAVALASQNVEKLFRTLPNDYSMVLTADHGGHARTHGLNIPEDMTIPIAFYGAPWQRGRELDSIRLIDIAPTIAAMMGCTPSADWDGRSLL